MSHKKIVILFSGILLATLIAGCTSVTAIPEPVIEPVDEIPTQAIPTATEQPMATEQPTVEQQATAAVSETQPAATPTLDVDALIREKLAGHHSIDRVYAADKTREEWNTTLDRMISYGAKISEEEKQIIIDYLLSR